MLLPDVPAVWSRNHLRTARNGLHAHGGAFAFRWGHHRQGFAAARAVPLAVVDDPARNGLSIDQHVPRHHGDCARHALVGVHHRAGGDLRHVARAPDVRVHAVDVHRRVPVVRDITFAGSQRHPAHPGATDVDGDAQMRAAHPGHQGRRVHRAGHVVARAPAPAAAIADPAAIVEGRKAPGRFVYPGPAPGADPDPAALLVRRPTGAHLQRKPDRAVLLVLFPTAVAVQVFSAGHLGRNVAR